MTTKTSLLSLLVAESEPDSPPTFTYYGPPIGFGARVVEHRAPGGTSTNHIFGNIAAPRPRYYADCIFYHCTICRPETPESSQKAVCARGDEFESPRTSPIINAQKVIEKIELNVSMW